MRLRNNDSAYGLPAIAFHWVTAAAVAGLFGLGAWMVELSYYDPWYHKAPTIHKSIGVLLFALTLLRLLWVLTGRHPQPPPHSPAWERAAARIAHGALYLLLVLLMVSGYLISTAEGHPIPLFGWIEIPALPWALAQQAEIAGRLHRLLAYTLVGLVCLHALAALKHHFIDHDETLRRMLGLNPQTRF